jgi:hypothetical protein
MSQIKVTMQKTREMVRSAAYMSEKAPSAMEQHRTELRSQSILMRDRSDPHVVVW